MKSVALRAAVAVALLVAGAALRTEARLTRQVAALGGTFVTLQPPVEDAIDEDPSMLSRLLWRSGRLRDEAGRLRVRMGYWRALPFDPTASIVPATADETTASPTTGTGSADADPEVLLAAANTAFRVAQRLAGDRAVVVERLDKVLQAYAEVMRADAANANAAYNYELTARYRDAIASGNGTVRRPAAFAAESATPGSLPSGPTIHGLPGANQPEVRVAGGGSAAPAEPPLVESAPDRARETGVTLGAAPPAEAAAVSSAVTPAVPATATSVASAPSSIPDARRGSVTVSASNVVPVIPPAPMPSVAQASDAARAPNAAATPGTPRVFFVSPKNGQTFLPYQIGTFEEPVVFTFGVANVRIAPAPETAGPPRAGVGHYHFGIETGCLPAGTVIPRSDTWIHLDAAESRHEMVLDRPGDRTFAVQLGDDEHRVLPGLCATITVKVLPY
jgi:hypothetical protein